MPTIEDWSNQQIWNHLQAVEAETQIKPGSIWQHYKGGIYQIVALAIQEGSKEKDVMVVYRHLNSGVIWTRPIAEWREPINESPIQGKPRFLPCDLEPKHL